MRITGQRAARTRGQRGRGVPAPAAGLLLLVGGALGVALVVALGLGLGEDAWARAQHLAKTWLAGTKESALDELRPHELPVLRFDIGFEAFQQLSTKRDEALARGILELDDEDWVRGEIRYLDKTVPVRVRLKGDWLDHLGEKKWSFRVKTRGDAALMGMRSFSVQSPR